MCRMSLIVVAFVAVLVSTPRGIAAQDVTFAAAPSTNAGTVNLAFSKDGRFLREVLSINAVGTEKFSHVRAITYVAATGDIRHVRNLQPDTFFFSATPDGQVAIISADRDRRAAQLFLFDTETGRTQDIPASWFDADDWNPYAQISADGRLVSAYGESDAKGGRVVTLYDWRTKKAVAERSEGYPAGGIDWGGVTNDGKIEFLNNRGGGDIVDPKTGRLLVSVGPNSLRSRAGEWVVEFPNSMIDEQFPEIKIKNGRSGGVVGKLNVQITDDNKEKWAWGRGAFCGTSGRFIATNNDTVQAFELPSGKKIAEFPKPTWQDPDAVKTNPGVTVACSFDAKHVAIRSGARLTLHDLH